MLDPIVSLAFALYSNKGAYALLVGSGVSRSAGIPTGWEIVLDLIRKLAVLEDADCEPDPVAWFKTKFGSEPDYSNLLDSIVKTSTERQQLLRAYFEPSDDDRAQALKIPTAAHKAIAQLVASGHVRVIVTTNFDRLAERALEEVGITPTVISTIDQISGALPLVHSGPTVIKVHGDYLDTRLKNTAHELAEYEPALASLLTRVFDEYGLIVCGWSADWDTALRSAIERSTSRRFTTYWATRSPLSDSAQRLANHRAAQVLKIRDANQLFEGLREKVLALVDMSTPHPLSGKMAAAVVKKYVVDPAARIRLRDIVHEETERLFAELTDNAFPPHGGEAKSEINRRISKYEALSDPLISILITGCFWGGWEHTKNWVSALERIANPTGDRSGLVYLLNLRYYPALFLLYGAGIAAIANGNYATLAALLTGAKAKGDEREPKPLCLIIYPTSVLADDAGRLLDGMDRRYTPVSDHLFEVLRSHLREYLPSDENYQANFDRFEYFLGLVHAYQIGSAEEERWWGPVGTFGWRGRSSSSSAWQKISQELDADGPNWPPLKAGLFRGQLDEAKLAIQKFNVFVSGLRWR